MDAIYLDHAATTPLHPQVLEAMMPIFQEHFGNPSSLHSFGRAARQQLNDSRDTIASLLGCESSELIFTSGGTESNNLAIVGAVRAHGPQGHIITTAVEHHAVLESCRALAGIGYDVTYLPVDHYGQIDVERLRQTVRDDTILISVQYGNNEVGTVQPIEAIAQIAHERNILLHVDAVQALGIMPLDLKQLSIDLMSFSAHKINGPKGSGLLYAAAETKLMPLLSGGVQERRRRAGTEFVAGAAGFAAALKLAEETRQEAVSMYEGLRQTMLDIWHQELSEQFSVNGHPTERLPHILNVSFPAVSSETMLMNLDLAGVAASSGSACNSGSLEQSHVIKAMKLPDEIAQSAIRFSFGRGNTREEVTTAAQAVTAIVNRLKSI